MPQFIDLTHPIVDGQPSYPGDPSLSVEAHCTVEESGANVTRLSMGTHQGTHLDAPYHFYSNGTPVDDLPLDRFCGPAKLVDLAPGAALPAHSPITIEMLLPHEAAFQPGARVIYRTGWDAAFGTARFFTDYPTLTLDAARWIASRSIALLGMDTPTPSVDGIECHHILLAPEVQIIIVESLAGLERLPPQFTFIGFPLRLAGRDGSPIRAVAMVP